MGNFESLESITFPGDGVGISRKVTRERSTIQFPYGDLNDAVEVARTLHGNGGAAGLPRLASDLGYKGTYNGAFREKVAASRVFGITSMERDSLNLTDLGKRILMPEHAPQARVDAFLSVPLYRKVYEKFKGYSLPPDQGLNNLLQDLGVTVKVAGKARQSLKRSAEQAGFFSNGNRSQLIVPSGTSDSRTPFRADASQARHAVLTTDATAPSVGSGEDSRNEKALSRSEGHNGSLDPTIQGMLDKLPRAEVLGESCKWDKARLDQWAAAFVAVLQVVYEVDTP